MRHILTIGMGGVGRHVAHALQNDVNRVRLSILVRRQYVTEVKARVAEIAPAVVQVVDQYDRLTDWPELAIECAGHGAVGEYGEACLTSGARFPRDLRRRAHRRPSPAPARAREPHPHGQAPDPRRRDRGHRRARGSAPRRSRARALHLAQAAARMGRDAGGEAVRSGRPPGVDRVLRRQRRRSGAAVSAERERRGDDRARRAGIRPHRGVAQRRSSRRRATSTSSRPRAPSAGSAWRSRTNPSTTTPRPRRSRRCRCCARSTTGSGRSRSER